MESEEKDKNDEKRSKRGPEKSQGKVEKETLLSTFC